MSALGRFSPEKVALQKIDARSGDVYRLAKQMRRDNQDVMGENICLFLTKYPKVWPLCLNFR